MTAIGAEQLATSICVVLPVTSALMVPLPLSYNRFATDCAKEVISAAVPLARQQLYCQNRRQRQTHSL
jgi:hypothetical protein